MSLSGVRGAELGWSPRNLARRPAVRAASLTGIVAVLMSPGLLLGPFQDAAVFVLIGKGIRGGEMPYRDLWDHKPPGVYLLNALGQSALPWLDPWLVAWLLSVVGVALAVVLMDRILGRHFSPLTAFVWALVFAVGTASYPMALGGGLSETFAVLPLVCVVWLVDREPASLRAGAAVGLLLAGACTFSIQAAPAGPAVVIVLLVRRQGRALAGLTLGPAAIMAAVLAWLAGGSAVAAAWDQLVVYQAAYQSTYTGDILNPIAGLIIFGGVLVLAAAALVRVAWAPRSFRSLDWVCVVWLAASILLLIDERRFYLHYAMPAAIPAVYLSASGGRWLWALAGSERRRVRLAARGARSAALTLMFAGGTLLVCLSLVDFGAYASWDQVVARTSDWIRSNTPSGDRLFVWGDHTEMYLAADRPLYGRYSYEFPMVTKGYWTPEMTDRLLQDWRVDPPDLIVEVPVAVPLFQPPIDDPEGRNYDTLQPLRSFVAARYRLEMSTEKSWVYVLTDTP